MMLRQRFGFLIFCLAIFCVARFDANAQEKSVPRDLSVVGVKLGSRASGKAFLDGFQARIAEDGRPIYYFYNKFANQVMKLTGASFEDRFFITEIEVYRVGKSYQAPHFQAEKIGYFKTENNIFIGYKQSTASMITGIPNVDGKDTTGPKNVVKKLGEPTEKAENGERETFVYKAPEIELADENAADKMLKFSYSAQYEFNEGKLKKFILKISPEKASETK